MKYLIYSNTGLTSKQLGLTAEIIENLRGSGNQLMLVLCDNVLDNCYFNRVHNVLGCASCQSRMLTLLKQGGLRKEEIHRLKRYPEAYSAPLPPFRSMDDLYGFSFEGINVGRGVASSVISYTRDFDLIQEPYLGLIKVELHKSINVLLNFRDIFKSYQPDELYLFNGRFAEVFPVMELARAVNLPFYTLESGAGNNYEMFRNHLPHSIASREKSMHLLWEATDAEERVGVGSRWFEMKRSGDESIEPSFTRHQDQERLPDDYQPARRNIALLNSSQDEQMAVPEWKTPLYEFQNEAIRQILNHFRDRNDLHFYLRIHPNLGTVDNIQMREIRKMSFPNLTIIPPDSKISTYKLIDACEKVITFGSSTGIEAAFWGRPSILYGRAFYENLGSVYRPDSFDALVALIDYPDLPPLSRDGALVYGHYMSRFGRQTTHFQFRGLRGSTYKGKRIRLMYSVGLLLVFRYLRRTGLWLKLHRLYYGKGFSLRSLIRYK
ncbi:MAG TPA: hypothetical protein P5550_00490 [Bacteroidales bacterium]|nr:hypothetical protein [Bacteroidales bacterium]HRZ76419.1 hypothetical protein [Bacteroidales bacterium]